MQAYPWAAGYINEQAQLLDRLMSLKEQEIDLQRTLVSMQQSHLRVRQAQMMNLLHYQTKHGCMEEEKEKKPPILNSGENGAKGAEISNASSSDLLEVPVSYINNLSASISATASAIRTTPTGSNAGTLSFDDETTRPRSVETTQCDDNSSIKRFTDPSLSARHSEASSTRPFVDVNVLLGRDTGLLCAE